MFFPYNIDNQIKVSKQSDPSDRRSVILLVFFVSMIVLYYFLRNILTNKFGFPNWVSGVCTIFISVVVGGILLRFLVFNERAIVQAEEDSESDSLGKYYKIRESELPIIMDGIEVFENTDGMLCACIEILYGPNSKEKSEFTLDYLNDIFKSVSNFSVDFRTYITRENFLRSKECKNFLKTVNNNSNTELKNLVSEMSDLILSYTELRSYLYSTFIIVRFPPISGHSLKVLRGKLNEIVSNENSSIRSIEFADRSRFREFIRNYNLVEALDLSNYKSSDITINAYRKYKKSIFVIEGVETKYEYKNGVKSL